MRRYLIVDDNVAFAENLAEIIADSDDAHADVAESGERAIAMVQQNRYDAVVSDMRMPLMNGAALVHNIRRTDPGLPAIVVTAYTGDDDLEAARKEGILCVLPKPVPVARLVQLLKLARRSGLVALVEDDAALADNLTEALRSRGFTAVTASSVTDAERFGEVEPFAALVDLRMPGGPDGEAMRRLASRFPKLPMIVVTGVATEPPLPAEAVFTKPFDTARLLDALDKLHRG